MNIFAPKKKTTVLTNEQIHLLDTATHLNIGCGHDYREGYVNIDMDANCNPDILLQNNDFSPLPKNRFEYAVVANIIEHIPRQFMMGALLDWASLLKIGGKMWLETSNPVRIAQQMEEKNNFERHYNWLRMMFGNQSQEGDYHFNGFTEITLAVTLKAAGLSAGEFTYIDGWVICTEATKEIDWADCEKFETLTDFEFIKATYLDILMRQADENGLTYHLELLSAGTPRLDVIKKLYSAEERLWNIAKLMAI